MGASGDECCDTQHGPLEFIDFLEYRRWCNGEEIPMSVWLSIFSRLHHDEG